MIICILGRQPQLGLAELESRFGADSLKPLGNEAALLDVGPKKVNHANLGGTIKIAQHIDTINGRSWQAAVAYCLKNIDKFINLSEDSKVTLGISAYGVHVAPRQLGHGALQIKKLLRSQKRSARVVPNTEKILNSAQVLHNQLTGPRGVEIVFVAHKGQIFIGRTLSVQDVDSYSKRDFERPGRDAFIGMLPPKLAQILISLANPKSNDVLMDPFCGTGVVLMESALQNIPIIGSDINPKMVKYSKDNLKWLEQNYSISPTVKELTVADAANHTWSNPIGCVACETYLGKPLASLPDSKNLEKITNECNIILRDFLENLAKQTKSGTRCAIAVPAWKTQNSLIHLPAVDDLKKMGYNRISFSYANDNDLIYHRTDQIVARELLVLTRI
ncbi:MAG: DNA methyltransferase [Candidatus Woesebacteria bacterium]|jgi:tRNA G10  N-methylase Trm11